MSTRVEYDPRFVHSVFDSGTGTWREEGRVIEWDDEEDDAYCELMERYLAERRKPYVPKPEDICQKCGAVLEWSFETGKDICLRCGNGREQ